MLASFTFPLGSTIFLKSILPALTRWFIEKQLLGANLLVTLWKHMWRSNRKSLLYMIYYPWHKIFRCRKLPHTFQTLWAIIEVAPLYFTYTKHKAHKILLIWLIQYPYCIPHFIVNQPSDKRILHIFNI